VASQWEKLFFEEIDGRRRRMVLQGTEAPKGHVRSKPAFSLGATTRRVLKPEPGVNGGTVHVTGLRFRDLVVNVHFRDSMSGDQGRGRSRVNLIDSIQESARPLRIVWGSVVRVGLLAEVDHGVEGEGEFDCTLTFEIHGTGQKRKRTAKRPFALSALLGQMGDALDVAKGAFKIPGISLGFGTMIEELLGAIAAPFASLLALADDVLGEIEDVGAAFQSAERRLLQIANHAKNIQRRSREAFGVVASSAEAIEDESYRAAWRRAQADALEALRVLATSASEVGEKAERKAVGSTSGALHTARDGETTEELARRFNTSPGAIRKLNPSLPVGALTQGVVVKLP
jgi:hypothetical protein